MAKAENRKSFIIHLDSLDVLDDMTDQQAGKLFKAIKADRKGEDIEIPQAIKFALTPFKNQFSRDDENYLKTVARNTANGLKKWEKENAKNASGKSGKQKDAKSADNDNDNESKKDKEIKNTGLSPEMVLGRCNKNLIPAMNDFLEMRKKIKKEPTPRALEMIMTELEKLAPGDLETQIEILNQSTSRNYTGVFPIKENYTKPINGTNQTRTTGQNGSKNTTADRASFRADGARLNEIITAGFDLDKIDSEQ